MHVQILHVPRARLIGRHRVGPDLVDARPSVVVDDVVLDDHDVIIVFPGQNLPGGVGLVKQSEPLVAAAGFAEEDTLGVVVHQVGAAPLVVSVPGMIHDVGRIDIGLEPERIGAVDGVDAAAGRTGEELVAGGLGVVELRREAAVDVGEERGLAGPGAAPAVGPVAMVGQSGAVGVGERVHDFAGAEGPGRVVVRQAAGVEIGGGIRIEGVIMRVARVHHVVEGLGRALVDDGAAAAGAAHAVGLPLGRGGRDAVFLVDDHDVV